MNALDESNVYRSSRSVDVELAKRNTNRLKLAFRKLLMDVAKVKSKHFDCGASLDGNRLVGIVTNPKNAKPFREISRAKTPNAAVSLIVDASSSMDYQNRFIKANTAALSIANALEPLRHVDVEVRHMYADNVFVTKPFSKKAEPLKFGVTTSGCTPTALVVGSAITSLMSLQKDRRMIIVITDGDANSIPDLKEMVETASMLGIEVKAIGIGVDSVSGIPNHCVINNVNELGTTLEGAVKTGLF
jgi:Mg-chelatase subunit ChlD